MTKIYEIRTLVGPSASVEPVHTLAIDQLYGFSVLRIICRDVIDFSLAPSPLTNSMGNVYDVMSTLISIYRVYDMIIFECK